jgi:hypothetical protein
VFEKSVRRRIIAQKSDEIMSWRKLCYERLHNLYSSSNIIRMIKSRRVSWAGNVAHMGRRAVIQQATSCHRLWVGFSFEFGVGSDQGLKTGSLVTCFVYLILQRKPQI